MSVHDPDDQNPDPLDPGDDASGEHAADGGLRGVIPELVRKVAVAGLGAVFMTEEGIRNLAGQLKLPKEALSVVLGQAEKTKEEIGRVISEELRRFLQSEKLRNEFLKMIAGMTIEVRAEVKLVPDRVKEHADTPSLLPKVNVTELKARTAAGKKPKE
ncbi:MAG: hypothetical protein JNK82_37410 [Myxococcaceae bacterium]|nr:hypothetical protein [Myxococcaceae bacterium]